MKIFFNLSKLKIYNWCQLGPSLFEHECENFEKVHERFKFHAD